MLKEEWVQIKGYEGHYQVSNYGRIYSTPKDGKKAKLLKLETVKKGYKRVTLSKNGKTKRYQVHRLVGQAFLQNPEGKAQINHIDNNPSNNRVDNLEWVSPSENMQHSLKQGRQIKPVSMAVAVLKNKAKKRYDGMIGQVFKNRKLLKMLDYGKHPKGLFECMECHKQFEAQLDNTIYYVDSDLFLGCRSCSIKHKKRSKI